VSTLTSTSSTESAPRQRTPRTIRGIYIANLVAQAGIVITGAVVRITESGLGCPTWPECVDGSITPTAMQEESWHKYVEFGNRLLTFVLLILAIAAVVAALVDRRRRRQLMLPPRPALTLLAFVPIAGTVVQAVLGGITVLTGLHPLTVGAHFLVSMAIIAGVMALVSRSADAGDQPVTWLVATPVRVLTWLLVAVTGSGPHSGDAMAERLALDPRTVSWLHADVVLLFLGLLIGLLVATALVKAPARLSKRAWLLLGIALTQGLIGYTQYFTGLPELLVIIHVLGAVLVWIAVLALLPALRTRG
jgi:cytochrome c oxidase assembly protein subunit 15